MKSGDKLRPSALSVNHRTAPPITVISDGVLLEIKAEYPRSGKGRSFPLTLSMGRDGC